MISTKEGLMSEKIETIINPSNIGIIWYISKLFLVVILFFAFCELLFGLITEYGLFILERILLFIVMVSFFSIREIYKKENKIIMVSSLGLSKASGINNDIKVFISFADIDIERTMKHNIMQIIFDTKSIYSNNKSFIEYTPQYYSRRDRLYLHEVISNACHK
jgi:hypothetical protein